MKPNMETAERVVVYSHLTAAVGPEGEEMPGFGKSVRRGRIGPPLGFRMSHESLGAIHGWLASACVNAWHFIIYIWRPKVSEGIPGPFSPNN